MGIVNVTPDSFSDGGRYCSPEAALEHALQMAEDGADILDIGGESTRPGAAQVDEAEELRRVIPILTALRNQTSAMISVDTYKASVAEAAIDAGADIINDISSLRFDSRMAEVVGRSDAGIILMHSRGTVSELHSLPPSADILGDLVKDLQMAVYKAFKTGISRDRMILDPGLGFGKNTAENLRILNRLSVLAELKLPILVGPSRKRFIGEVLNLPVSDRLLGTVAASVAAVANGAHIIRVHDVKEVRQALAIIDSISTEKPSA